MLATFRKSCKVSWLSRSSNLGKTTFLAGFFRCQVLTLLNRTMIRAEACNCHQKSTNVYDESTSFKESHALPWYIKFLQTLFIFSKARNQHKLTIGNEHLMFNDWQDINQMSFDRPCFPDARCIYAHQKHVSVH